MKKKVFLSIFALFVFCVCLIRVNAANEPLFSVGWDVLAKAPQLDSNNNLILPDDNLAYGTISQEFDFRKVIFADNGGDNLPGKSNLEKIIIGEIRKNNITNNNSAKKQSGESNEQYVSRLFNNYFTAYCLDENKMYPTFGLFNIGGPYGYSRAVNSDGTFADDTSGSLMSSIALAAIMNDSNFSSMVNDLVSTFDDPASIQVATSFDQVIIEMGPDDKIADYLDYLSGTSNTPVNEIGIRTIAFSSRLLEGPDSNKLVYYVSRISAPGSSAEQEAQELADYKANIEMDNPGSTVIIKYITGSAYANDYVPINSPKLYDLAFQKYKSASFTNHDHLLWIVENSYPTLDVDIALSKAGVDVATFNSQVKSLYSLTDEQVEQYKEMVVYGIVQYAIWKVAGSTVSGHSLGNEIKNATELDKLYKYLINQGNAQNGYSNSGYYSASIGITKPAAGKELYKSNDNGFDYYGPYKANYTALIEEGNKIQYAVTENGAAVNDVKMVNSSLSEITGIDKNTYFYLKVPHSKTFATLDVHLSVDGITTFSPSGTRGRVYSPVAAISQNSLIGGRARQVTIDNDFSVDGNPKTGVQNIALLLMVTLIAFTLGYLVLSYKQKSIQIQ